MDSTDTIPQAAPWEILKLESMKWRDLQNSSVERWNSRSEYLNSLPVIRRFGVIPWAIPNDLLENILQSLTRDWENFFCVMQNSIVRKPKKGLSLKSYLFGKETVTLKSQTHCRLYMNYLLRMCLFGQNMRKVRCADIIYKKRRHMSSILHPITE